MINHNMEDDVIRGATVTHEGEITFPPPPPKVKAIAAAKPKKKEKEPTAEEKKPLNSLPSKHKPSARWACWPSVAR